MVSARIEAMHTEPGVSLSTSGAILSSIICVEKELVHPTYSSCHELNLASRMLVISIVSFIIFQLKKKCNLYAHNSVTYVDRHIPNAHIHYIIYWACELLSRTCASSKWYVGCTSVTLICK